MKFKNFFRIKINITFYHNDTLNDYVAILVNTVTFLLPYILQNNQYLCKKMVNVKNIFKKKFLTKFEGFHGYYSCKFDVSPAIVKGKNSSLWMHFSTKPEADYQE